MTLTAVLPQSASTMTRAGKPSVIILNKLIGLIVARRHPHRCRHYQVRTADGIHVTVQAPAFPTQTYALSIGQQVSLRIPPHAVMISPARPIEDSEDNVWSARVVLPVGQERGSLLIVKILGRPWTLTSTQQEGQFTRALHTWDHVTVRIRPEACVIDQRYPDDSRLHPRLLTQSSCVSADSPYTQPGRRPPYPAHQGREPLSCVPCLPAPPDSCDSSSRYFEQQHFRRERSQV